MADSTRRQMLAGMAAMCIPAAGMTHLQNDISQAAPPSNAEQQPSFRESLLRILGDMPARPTSNFKVLESVTLDGGARHLIAFLSEPPDPRFHAPADVIRAYLFEPYHRQRKKFPAVLAIHQDGPQSHIGKAEPAGLAGDKNLFYGLELFQRGYVVLCPDRLGHAERRRVVPNDMTSIDPDRDDQLFNHRVGQLLLSGRNWMGKEVYDLMVSADILTSLDYVDRERLCAIGHSAGGNALVYFMFVDSRIRAGVSSCGLYDMARFFDENAPKKRLAATAIPDLANTGTSADYLSQIAPRPVLLTRGLWEWGRDLEGERFSKGHVQETRDMVAHAHEHYVRLGVPNNLSAVYFDEAGGEHAFPPHVRGQAYEWLDRYMKSSPIS